MNARRTPRRPFRRRLFRVRNLVVGLLVLLALAYLASPRRIHDIVSVDGAYRWQEDAAPPRYKIVWQPAVPVEISTPGLETGDSLIRPQFAEDGTVLYFTLRKSDGNADVYCRRIVDGVWQPAVPVEELNSEADEVGPVMRPDGRRLYLYSNRPGGFGGLDLYVSDRMPDGWSTPRNLGPRINTPANEYDPAISADGLRLVFASNQTPQMQRRTAEPGRGEPGDQWSTTLRADLGLTNFDLYMARRSAADDEWEAAQPLEELNRADSDEGAPYISPSGAFLFFVSNREVRQGEDPNFDIYRARIRGDQVSEVENLGSGVNTPANELEPALSPEGFRLFFSRNLPGPADQPEPSQRYAIYRSDATEVVEELGWGASRLGALLAFLARNWWWLVLFALTLALLITLIWYLREVSLRRLPVPGFVLAALLIHVFLGFGSFYVYFGEGILRQIKKELQQIVVATHMADENLHQSHEQGQEAYEKVADLKSVEAAVLSNVARQQTEMPNLPVPTDSPAPEIPARLEREMPADRLVAAPLEAEIDAEDLELQRRRRQLERIAEEQVEIEQTEAARQAPEQLERLELALSRRRPMTEMANVPRMLPRRTLDPAMQVEPEAVTAQHVAEAPIPTLADRQPAILLERTARAVAGAAAPAEQVATEALGAPAVGANAPRQSQRVRVDVARRQQTAGTALASLPTLRRLPVAGANVQPSPEQIAVQRISDGPIQSSGTGRQATTLERTARALAGPGTAPQVETEALGAPVTGPRTDQLPQRVSVGVSRRQPAVQVAGVPKMLRRRTASGGSLLPAPEEMAVQRISGRRAGIAVGPAADAPPTPQRGRATPSPAQENPQQIATVALAVSPGAKPGRTLAPPSVGVAVGRRGTLAPSPRSTVLNLGGLDRRIGLPGVDQPGPPAVEVASIGRPASGKVVARLARASRAGEVAETEAIATEQPGSVPAASTPGRASIAGVEVGVERPEARVFHVPVETSGRFGGRYAPRQERLVVGSLEKETVDAPPSFSPIASRIARRPARAPLLIYAEDNIGLQAMFRMRQGEAKRDVVRAFGGSDETLAAVRRGLEWLQKHQHADGYWSLEKFYHQDPGKSYPGGGNVSSDTAATGFGLLPFLGDGHTHVSGQYQSSVRKALEWLVKHQKENGDLATTTGSNTHMYAHAIAAIALCEAYGMSKDPELRDPAQRAIDFIVQAQHRPSGGWRYNPNQAADTSVVGWQVMAMKSGQMAALSVSQDSLNLVHKWLDSVEGKGREAGRFEYQRGRGVTPAMTAEALLCLQYLGADRNDRRLRAGADYLLENLPDKGKVNSYYWYYATQVMYHLQGEPWRQWNNALRDMLVETQHKEGHLAGTWDVKGEWEDRGGRIYSTSLRLLMLEVYYRHLPLYQLVEASGSGG